MFIGYLIEKWCFVYRDFIRTQTGLLISLRFFMEKEKYFNNFKSGDNNEKNLKNR